MLLRHSASKASTSTGYVCLSCRLQTKQQRRRVHSTKDANDDHAVAANPTLQPRLKAYFESNPRHVEVARADTTGSSRFDESLLEDPERVAGSQVPYQDVSCDDGTRSDNYEKAPLNSQHPHGVKPASKSSKGQAFRYSASQNKSVAEHDTKPIHGPARDWDRIERQTPDHNSKNTRLRIKKADARPSLDESGPRIRTHDFKRYDIGSKFSISNQKRHSLDRDMRIKKLECSSPNIHKFCSKKGYLGSYDTDTTSPFSTRNATEDTYNPARENQPTSGNVSDDIESLPSRYNSTLSLGINQVTMEALNSLEEAADRSAAVDRHVYQSRAREQPCNSNPVTPSHTGYARPQIPPGSFTSRANSFGTFARLYHTSSRTFQQAAVARAPEDIFQAPTYERLPRTGIRAQLQQWQDLHGHEDPVPEISAQNDIVDPDEPVNNLTRLPDEAAQRRRNAEDDEETLAFSRFANVGKEGFDGSASESNKYLKTGDLVEIDTAGEREGILAVFVRPVDEKASMGQFFSMRGAWTHVHMKHVQYSIPGFISPTMLEPLLEHLPKVDTVQDTKELSLKAYVEDLSVPREKAAPVVTKLLQFWKDAQEIYRKNASTLDNAHNILAHESDLRYGSLLSAATTLLKLPSDKLPLPALYTVRKALYNAGFAFNMDRRSHRLTGYLQIRSKSQVKMVETVRDWIRQWQDHVATVAGANDKQALKLSKNVPKGAQHVFGFIEKAKAIVAKNRENRPPIEGVYAGTAGSVSISKKRLPFTKGSECVKIEQSREFTAEEGEIVRFLEVYATANMFDGLPRLQSLPPLLVQATGLYPNDTDFGRVLAFVFLQELGTVMPYENRIRFDPHLLLPSSQHSQPLMNLMTNLMAMRDKPDFQDSMKDLRRDWGDMPVYCIDNADAHEIDDGISVESAGVDADGKELHWVHVHIANPTAFFSRDHPLAKMARHMGESIYMPERAYMMLPRWATQTHFSLAQNRPCLTFSAKMDSEGNTLEKKITPGIVRNVMRLTADDVHAIVGVEDESDATTKELVLTCGGDPPPPKARKSRVPDATALHAQQLKQLRELAEKRVGIRRRAGGFFFDSNKPEVQVWQNTKSTGLAWDHPHRKGRRTVYGDPVIRFKSTPLTNWFSPSTSTSQVLVREFMLLACELAASWCAERQIPVIYRGSVMIPYRPDPQKYAREILIPNTKPDGSIPMHIGRGYLRLAGTTALDTRPKWHNFLGMQHYSKATSPLRRYGDMILHWQIEAALRHEAQTGKSLVTDNPSPDRKFLPFSAPVLQTIMLGLQPRESIITRSKNYAESFWTSMLLFRKLHFPSVEGALPFSMNDGADGLPNMRIYLQDEVEEGMPCFGTLMELNCDVRFLIPKELPRGEGEGMEEARLGDVWECVLVAVNVFERRNIVRPIRLVGREGAGIL